MRHSLYLKWSDLDASNPNPSGSSLFSSKVNMSTTVVSNAPSTSKRLSKKLTKRYSAPNTSTTPTTRTTSNASTKSAPASTTPATEPRLIYNPLQNYIPCLYPTCTAHYAPTTLGPTFYLPQAPYSLIRKRGLCPSHGSKDLRIANEHCKKAWESMRQNAGRKTLGLVAAEFEIWVHRFREQREGESMRNEARQKRKVLGWSDGGKGDGGPAGDDRTGKGMRTACEGWDWRYAPRPCTKKGCTREWYSVFDARLYHWYSTKRKSGCMVMETLCPACAREDVELLERRVLEKRQEMDEQGWTDWVEQVKKDRETELQFWEKAQARIVMERGVRFCVSEAKREPDLEGKGVDLVRELCVIM